MPRAALAILLIATAVAGRAQYAGGPLVGHIEGDRYFAPNGSYQVAIPVRPKMGAIVTDTPNVVTFKDDYDTLFTIASFPLDASQRWLLSENGTREYLRRFFNDYVLPDFRHAFKGVEVEDKGVFMPEFLDGVLVIYTLLPGGSMFADDLAVIDPNQKPPVAKRGNMLFVKNGFVFVVSTELAERVTEGSAYSMKPAEENTVLREKLTDMASKIRFPKSPPSP